MAAATVDDILADLPLGFASLMLRPSRTDAAIERFVIVDADDETADGGTAFVLLIGVRGRSALPAVRRDAGMGFEWARPTSFADPIFPIGEGLSCYAVDHSPSFLWDSATWEISQALTPHLATVISGPRAWEAVETLRRAIGIRDGVIQNPKILSFQGRSATFPHLRT